MRRCYIFYGWDEVEEKGREKKYGNKVGIAWDKMNSGWVLSGIPRWGLITTRHQLYIMADCLKVQYVNISV